MKKITQAAILIARGFKVQLVVFASMILMFSNPNSSIAQILLQEDFTAGVMPPAGWTITGSPTATNWGIATPGVTFTNPGGAAPIARFNWSPSQTNYDAQLESPIINATANASVTLDYNMALDDYGGSVNNWEIQYKTTVSGTWTTLETFANNGGNLDIIRTGQVLTGMGGNNFQIRVRIYSLSGTSFDIDGWFWDHIVVNGIGGGCQPPANIGVSGNPTTICNGSSTTLTATGGISYTWEPGTLSGTQVTVSPTSNTVYTVTGSNGTCTATATVLITVNPVPTVSASASPATVGCSTANVQLTATPPPSCIANYNVSSIAYAPVTGTPIAGPTGDDNVSGAIPIGFNFNFYCTTYNSVYIGTNGFITFTAASPSGCCSGQNIPAAGSPNNLVALCWTDLNVGSPGVIDYFNLTSPNRFVVRYTDVAHCCGTTPGQISGEIILYETGVIEIHTTYATNIGTMTQGIENSTGTVATAVPGRNATGWTATNDAYRFTPQVSATYAWLPGGGTGVTTSVTGISATTVYTVTATNTFGCTASATTQVTFNPVTASCSGTNASCNGGSNGTAAVVAGGGNAPYTYMWSNSQTTASISGLAAGQYCVTVTDAFGCTATCCYTVTQPIAISFVVGQTEINCSGGADGTAGIGNLSGGKPFAVHINSPYSLYLLATNAQFGPATYNVTADVVYIQDGTASYLGCNPYAGGSLAGKIALIDRGTCGFAVKVLNAQNAGALGVIMVQNSAADPITMGGTGAITIPSMMISLADAAPIKNLLANSTVVNATLSSTSFQYLWSNTNTTPGISGLNAGTYTLTVTDAAGCSVSGSTVLVDPPALALTVTGSSLNCNGDVNGTASATPSGGSQNCDVSATGPLFNNALIDAATKTGQSFTACNTGTITSIKVNVVIGTPGTAVLLMQPGLGTITPTYTEVVNSPTVSGDWIINLTTPFPVVAGTVYSFTLGGPGSTIVNCGLANTNPSTYADGTMIQNNGLFSAQDLIFSLHIAGTIDLPFAYAWSNNQTTSSISGLGAGTYTVTVTSAHGCVISGTATVTEPPLLTANCSGSNVSCNGGSNGSASVVAGGGTPGYSYLWSNSLSTSSITGLAAGIYCVTITDANGCTATCCYTVTEPTLLTLACNGTNVSCNGGSNGSLSAVASGGTGGYSYYPSSSLGNLSAGTYCITVTDANGCTASCCYTVTEPALISINPVVSNVHCRNAKDGSIVLVPTGGTPGYTYQWNNGNTNSSRTGLAPGTYCVTVRDLNNCTATACFTITQPATSLVLNTSKTNVRCGGKCTGVATVAPTGGCTPYSYQWNTGSALATIGNLCAGTYTCVVTDGCGCVKTATIVITQNAPLVVVVVQTGSTQATASVSGGCQTYTYYWNTFPTPQTTQTATGLIPGNTYKVRVTDCRGCSQTAIITIALPKSSAISSGTSGMDISAYPNPTTGKLTVNFNDVSGSFKYDMKLMDITGRVVFDANAIKESGSSLVDYDFGNLPKGIYTISIQTDKANSLIKIVIQ